MSVDPWFQSLFAERIGGSAYGKGTEIYKFEKIKRAKRMALADYPDRQLAVVAICAGCDSRRGRLDSGRQQPRFFG